MWRLCLVISVLIVGLVLGTGSVKLVYAADFILSGDSDCALIGIWNTATKTCTLVRNVNGSIAIRTSGVTLDGAGFSIIGPGIGQGEAIDILNFNQIYTDIAIKNVTINGWGVGIALYRTRDITIASSTIADNRVGVSVSDSPFVSVKDTRIRGNDAGLAAGVAFSDLRLERVAFEENTESLSLQIFNEFTGTNLSIDTSNTIDGKPIYYFEGVTDETHEDLGDIAMLLCQHCKSSTFGDFAIDGNNSASSVGVQLWHSDDNVVHHGEIRNVKIGANIFRSKRNFFHDNTFHITNATPEEGPAVGVSSDPFTDGNNSFLDNNFIEPEPLTAATMAIRTRNANFWATDQFYSPLLERGNYWSRYDSEAEGCGDFDGDRKCDSSFSIYASGERFMEVWYAWAYKNAWDVTPSVPSIVSISPTSGPVGTLVTITGSNFGSTQGSSTVSFGAIAANVSSWNDTQIQATVPSLSAGNYSVVVITGAGSSNPVVFNIEQKILCNLGGINDVNFERAFPEIKRYLRRAFKIAGVSQNILEAVTWGEFQGTPLWNILIFAITVDDLLQRTDGPLDRINHERVLLDLTSFTAEWGFTSLLSSLGPSFAGVAAWASLASLPITSSLQLFYRAVTNAQIRRQIELYFLARNAGCSYESIVNSQDDCAGATLFYDNNGWLYAVDAGLLGNKKCDGSACVPRPLTPAEVYEYAEWLRSLEEVRANYLQDKVKIENILRDRIAQCLE